MCFLIISFFSINKQLTNDVHKINVISAIKACSFYKWLFISIRATAERLYKIDQMKNELE